MSRRDLVLIPYPPEVIDAVDRIASEIQVERTTFLVQLAEKEIKRQRLLQILSHPDPIWRPEDHPEIDDGGDWLREMRAESERRFNRISSRP